ncbi:hypothetical protein EON82_22345, partial [bacterium]
SRTTLTNLGILAAPSTETIKTEINIEREMTEEDLKHLEVYGELGPQVLARLGKNAPRNRLIVDQYVQNRERYGPTIVFAADTLHAQTLAQEFKNGGVERTDYVDYSRRDSAEVIRKYSDGELDVIVNVQMLTEGFDAPRTRTVFIARPTRSQSLVVQMVGRALRGKQARGNDRAYLVSFLDTWTQYDVLGPEYALDVTDAPPAEPSPERGPVQLVPIPPELLRDAYRLLQSTTRGLRIGVHACTPHGWYRWEEEFEDDVQSRLVMIFDTQVDGMRELLAAYSDPAKIPTVVTEAVASSLVREFFADVPDPLPRWADVKALLDAKRKECEIAYVSFDEKRSFDPSELAQKILDERMDPVAEAEFLQGVWDAVPACGIVYRQDQTSFREEVGRERTKLLNAKIAKPKAEAVVSAIVPSGPPRAWPAGSSRPLGELLEGVLSVKRHFPSGMPTIGEMRWMTGAHRSMWGFFRHGDKRLALNPLLDSPDVPRFVAEFVLYHELLHAEMPSAGHNADFRARERAFTASARAIEEAREFKIAPAAGSTIDFWRVRADMFLDTQYYKASDPRSYDDTGWTLGPLFDVQTLRIKDPSILDPEIRKLR